MKTFFKDSLSAPDYSTRITEEQKMASEKLKSVLEESEAAGDDDGWQKKKDEIVNEYDQLVKKGKEVLLAEINKINESRQKKLQNLKTKVNNAKVCY